MKGMMNFEWRIGWKVDRLSRYWNTDKGAMFGGFRWRKLVDSLGNFPFF